MQLFFKKRMKKRVIFLFFFRPFRNLLLAESRKRRAIKLFGFKRFPKHPKTFVLHRLTSHHWVVYTMAKLGLHLVSLADLVEQRQQVVVGVVDAQVAASSDVAAAQTVAAAHAAASAGRGRGQFRRIQIR